MKIVTEHYNDNGLLSNRIEEFFCSQCGKKVNSELLLKPCKKFGIIKNPSPSLSVNPDNQSYYELYEEHFRACIECVEKLNKKI